MFVLCDANTPARECPLALYLHRADPLQNQKQTAECAYLPAHPSTNVTSRVFRLVSLYYLVVSITPNIGFLTSEHASVRKDLTICW